MYASLLRHPILSSGEAVLVQFSKGTARVLAAAFHVNRSGGLRSQGADDGRHDSGFR